MNRIKSLNRFQKGILIVMIVMAVFFAVFYIRTISRVGFRYNDAIFVPAAEGEKTVYSGKIDEEPASFTVSGQSVVFQCGERTYGPYTMKIDPTAIPSGYQSVGPVTGIEMYDGNEMIFRGCATDMGDYYWLQSETYDNNIIGFSYTTSDGVERDAEGKPVDPMKPFPSVIYELLTGPKLTHEGNALGWFGAVFVCVLNFLSMIFADELFHLNLSFRIRDAYQAEPSSLEMAGRYIGWIVLPVVALMIFIIGLL